MAISLPVTSRRRYYGSAISTYARKLRRGRNVGVFPNIISSGYFSMRAVKCTRRRDRALGKGGVCAFQKRWNIEDVIFQSLRYILATFFLE